MTKTRVKKNVKWLYGALASFVLVILILVDGYIKGAEVDWPPFNIFLTCAIVLILFYFIPSIPSFYKGIIGETHLTADKPWRIILAAVFLIPFAIHMLIGGQTNTNLQWVDLFPVNNDKADAIFSEC